MGWSTLFKYMGLAMEVATTAAAAMTEVAAAQAPGSPGGSEITSEEGKQIIENLDDEFSQVVTRICEEVGLPVKSVKVEIELE